MKTSAQRLQLDRGTLLIQPQRVMKKAVTKMTKSSQEKSLKGKYLALGFVH
jgi:hypothetical protein